MTNEEARARVDDIHMLAHQDKLEEADKKRWLLFLDTLSELTTRGNLITEDLVLITMVSEVL